MAQNVVEEYYNRILHLRSARHFLNDIELIHQTVLNFDVDTAEQVISYISIKYKKDINQLGRLMTGVMVFKPSELPPKTEADLENDLYYLRDCLVIFAAVHTGVENTLHSAVVKINRQNEEAIRERMAQHETNYEELEEDLYDADGGEVFA